MVTPGSKKGSGDAPRRLSASTSARLRAALGEESGTLPFAEAVTLHLARAPGRDASPQGEAAAAARVLDLLSAPPGEGARFAADPELLASAFQNADLLQGAAAPAADRIGLLVMRALEAADLSR